VSASSTVLRARWSALLTDAAVVSSDCATSRAANASTSRRISTARWRAGRCCSAAMNASSTLSRCSAIALREPGQFLRIEHDHHLFGVVPDATWRRLIDDSGLELVDVDVEAPMQTSTWRSLVGVPPAERQNKAR
jgi:hypothetical protein